MTLHTVFLSIGSNIGDKLANCRAGTQLLTRDNSVSILARSPFYQTEPVDYTDQDWFVNAALKIETRLDPQLLLERIQQVQQQVGRKHDTIRFGPRILDIDIIFFDDRIIELSELIIPHPRAHKRRFVLQPICDIDRAIIHPVLKVSVQTLLDRLDDSSQAIKRIPCCD